jgi:hypothetical protein
MIVVEDVHTLLVPYMTSASMHSGPVRIARSKDIRSIPKC